MRFLCNSHREQTLSDPKQAIHYWELWMTEGEQHCQRGDWQSASHFFGCSFEVGEWLIHCLQNQHQNTGLNFIERMMLAGHSLAECYKKMDLNQHELDILVKVHNLLTYTNKHFIQSHWLMDSYIARSFSSIQQYSKTNRHMQQEYIQPHAHHLH